MKPITSTLTLSLIRCHWLFHRIFNPGINPGIPVGLLQNPNPEIARLGSGPGIASTTTDDLKICCGFHCEPFHFISLKLPKPFLMMTALCLCHHIIYSIIEQRRSPSAWCLPNHLNLSFKFTSISYNICLIICCFVYCICRSIVWFVIQTSFTVQSSAMHRNILLHCIF